MGSGNNDNLTAAYIDKTVVIRVEGRGSFKVSPPMKQFIHQVMDSHSATRIWIDMSDCTGMDSTFMGVVAGLACLIKSKPDCSFKLINLSEKNKKLLVTLGVDRVVDYSMSPTTEETDVMAQQATGTQTLEADFANKLDSAKTTLEAHETLVDINPENFNKFKSVLEFLQDDVRNLSNK
ncbi:STAS domain-containing protein [Pontiella sp.]|uniref:STAS domain-containing protein n=1 Tax=Pontiella sp. TaxID=2837462 RepID=UPI003567F966